MKKSTLLSLLTAGAVIATSAGTFAAWDTLTAEADGGSIKFDRINVTASTTSPLALVDDGNVLHAAESQVASAEIKVDLSTVPEALTTGNKVKLVFAPTVTDSSSAVVDASKYKIEILDSDGTTPLKDSTDTTLTSTSNNYTVKVTPLDTTLGGETLKVKVIATLEEVSS